MSAAPDVSVVVATHNRRARLESLLAGLRSQTYPRDRFEVVIVDDASTDGTAELLGREAQAGEIEVSFLRMEQNSGPAVARERGWRAARASVIAFTDDDCVPDPGWLESGLEACRENPGAIVQGATIPDRREWDRLGPLERASAHTMDVPGPDPHLQTCNVFYPREELERVGGFDTVDFARNMAEDADLAWRALEQGASATFAPEARVVHAYNVLGALGMLRRAATRDLAAYARHPGLRAAWFRHRIFWQGRHYLLLRALLAAALPRRMRFVRAWLGVPYAVHLSQRGRKEGGGLLLAPYYLVCDLAELAGAVRNSIRYRVPML